MFCRFEHLAGNLGVRSVVRLRGEPFEDRLIGRIEPALALAPAFVAEPFEQHFAQLLGAADRERTAGKTVDRGFQLADGGIGH